MTPPLDRKSTTDEIRSRFDNDVERFSEVETGQTAAIDAPLALDLIARAACAATTSINKVLDVGCGAGNFSLRLRQVCGRDFDLDLLDLSRPMLDRARERLKEINKGNIRTLAADIRHADLATCSYDIILAGAVLHHLRDDADWNSVFRKLFTLLAPGGSIWIFDLVSHEVPAVQDMILERYGAYLSSIGGADHRDAVFAYIDREDSPRPITYQLDLLRRVGFDRVELLHQNTGFAAFGGIKPNASTFEGNMDDGIVVASHNHIEDWLMLRDRVYTGLQESFHREEMATWIAAPDRRCWILYEDGKALGFIEASLRNIVDGCITSPVGYIEGIFVRAEARGRGLARGLIGAAEHWMRTAGCVEIATDAEIDNNAAIAYHEAMGFEETYRIVEFRKSLSNSID